MYQQLFMYCLYAIPHNSPVQQVSSSIQVDAISSQLFDLFMAWCGVQGCQSSETDSIVIQKITLY